MAIIRLQHVGIVVRDFERACRCFEEVLGMKPRDFRDDQSEGKQHDSRVLLGNDCWIHVVYNWHTEKRPYRYLQERGEGLEHIALESDDIEADVERIRKLGVPIFRDEILNANDGYEAFVYPQDGIGFTVELIQPHKTSWTYPENAQGTPVSSKLGVCSASSLSAMVGDVETSRERFASLFGLASRDGFIQLGDNCRLELETDSIQEPRDHGLQRIAFDTDTLHSDLEALRSQGVAVAEDGFLSDCGVGFPIQLS